MISVKAKHVTLLFLWFEGNNKNMWWAVNHCLHKMSPCNRFGSPEVIFVKSMVCSSAHAELDIWLCVLSSAKSVNKENPGDWKRMTERKRHSVWLVLNWIRNKQFELCSHLHMCHCWSLFRQLDESMHVCLHRMWTGRNGRRMNVSASRHTPDDTMCRLFNPESGATLQGHGRDWKEEAGWENPLYGGGRVGWCQAERRVREGEETGGWALWQQELWESLEFPRKGDWWFLNAWWHIFTHIPAPLRLNLQALVTL